MYEQLSGERKWGGVVVVEVVGLVWPVAKEGAFSPIQ